MAIIYIWGDPQRFQNYSRAVVAAGGKVKFGGDPAGCDGLLLPGGGDLEPWRYGQENTASRGLEPRRDREELELLDWFMARKRPVLGICRGMQVINVYFGGTLAQDIPGHSQFGGQDRFHRVRSIPSPLSVYCGEVVNSAHHQAVDCLGSGLEAVQWAPDGVVEALCHRRLSVWGVQWHPERMPPFLSAGVLKGFVDSCVRGSPQNVNF